MRRSPQSIEELKPILAEAALALNPNPNEISCQELAKSAGLAIGTIYRIIPSKSDLFNLVAEHAEKQFNEIVFAPIRGGLAIRERFSLIFKRIFEFNKTHKPSARFLAFHGFGPQSLFLKSSDAFSKEGIATNIMDESTAPLAHALIWGPIAISIQNQSNPDIGALEEKVWHTLAA